MSEPTPLRPIGTQFEHTAETNGTRTIYVYRVTGHTILNDLPSELIQLVAVKTEGLPKQIGGSERKAP